MAAHCERFARQSHSSMYEHLLLEAAKQWRSRGDVARLAMRIRPEAAPVVSPDEPMLAEMLSDIGALVRQVLLR